MNQSKEILIPCNKTSVSMCHLSHRFTFFMEISAKFVSTFLTGLEEVSHHTFDVANANLHNKQASRAVGETPHAHDMGKGGGTGSTVRLNL